MAIFGWFGGGRKIKELEDKVSAISRTQAVIEFDANGTVLDVNDNFLRVMGYDRSDVIGRHHRMFVEVEYANGQEYQAFWDNLRRGESKTQEFKRLGKGNKEVWIHGSYNPLADSNGQVYKVVKFASDITERKKIEKKNAETANYANALKLCQANVMLADNDFNIVYMNDTVTDMLRNRETELRTELKDFNVAKLVGTCVDSFHNKPSHQRKFVGSLTEAYKTNIKVAGLTFELIASPWYDLAGQRVGTVVEWQDKTDELALKEEAESIAAENLRVRQALDACDTSVMIADANLNIIYLNKAVQKMLQPREVDIRKHLPNFSVSSLVGTCVDDFHEKPSHQRGLLNNLKSSYRTDLKLSGLTFGLIATPLVDAKGKRLGTVVEWDDKTDRLAKEAEARRLAEENARVKQALDSVTTNVMIADKDSNIVYLNGAVVGMMQTAEADIRKALPNFNASRLLGVNMDVFHKDPSHQRNIMQNLKGTYNGNAFVGGRTFTVIANPVFQDGERIGTVVEWADRTEEVAIEGEVNNMVKAAGEGDFTKQISMDGKKGFFANLGRGLNELVSTMEVATNDIMRMLGAMSKGDLSERITREYLGAFGQLKNDANLTADKLTEVIGKIRSSSGAILSAANEIAQGNADLSQRTEEQASSLEETASSMEEMTSTVKQSAENAQKANDVSQQAQNKAKEGGQVVSKAVQAMEEINASSKKISDIIGVIDEIAFQTNLLALNAAVEAARAGEQGRGFAVVAGEVRNLAQRSAGAAKEIKDLIRDSVSKVQDGRELVNASGQTLEEIVLAVENVSNMMRDIAEAAREQTTGIEQVNTAVSQMDEMTQQNAALVEEASAAGAALADQATSMNAAVEFFSISSSGQQRGSMISRAPKPIARASAVKSKKSPPPPSSTSYDDDEWEEF